MGMVLLAIISSLCWQDCKVVSESKCVFQEFCNEGRGELVFPLICSVFPFVKNLADSMDFDSSLQLLAMCV